MRWAADAAVDEIRPNKMKFDVNRKRNEKESENFEGEIMTQKLKSHIKRHTKRIVVLSLSCRHIRYA